MYQSAEVFLAISVAFLVTFEICAVESRHTVSTDTDMSFIRACNETSPVSLATVNEVLVHKRLRDEEYKFQCFLHCLFTKYGWMDEEGGFLLAEMKHVLEETLDEPLVLKHLLYECTAMEEMDRCHRAFKFTRCFWKKLDQHTQPETDHYNVYNMDDPTEDLQQWV